MKTTHTPGPWSLEVDAVISDATEAHICTVLGGEGTRFIDDEDNQECLANARLIAAAPDLLDALKEVQDWANDGFRVALRDDQKAKIAAAIAKAEGR